MLSMLLFHILKFNVFFSSTAFIHTFQFFATPVLFVKLVLLKIFLPVFVGRLKIRCSLEEDCVSITDIGTRTVTVQYEYVYSNNPVNPHMYDTSRKLTNGDAASTRTV